VVANAQKRNLTFDPTDLWDSTNPNFLDPQQQVDFFADLLLGGQLSQEARAALVDHMVKLRVAYAGVLPVKERLRSLVYLILASPDYQLA
jgi:hypothetical protein